MTLTATFVSVVFAVALFWYQRDKSDEARQEQLLLSLVAEARACLDMLAERPAETPNVPVGSGLSAVFSFGAHVARNRRCRGRQPIRRASFPR